MKCPDCNEWRVEDTQTATAVCPKCGDVQPYHNPAPYEALSAQDQSNCSVRRQRFMYKRLSHFRMWLDRLQGRDHVPAAVLRVVRAQLAVMPIKRAPPSRLRAILKETGHSAYVNSLPSLFKLLYNETPARLTPTECLEAESLFQEIEQCFVDNIVPAHPRKNLLSYSFLLREILQLLGVVERFPYLKELKHVDKRREAAEVWEMIREDLQL